MSRIDLSRNRYWAAAIVMAAAVFLIIGSFSLSSWITKAGQAAQLDPRQAVEQAWQRARQLGSYRFTTNLEAEISATGQPVPENSARYERLYLEGQVNLPAQKIELTIWERGGIAFNTRQGIQVRIEGGEAYGRVGSGDWQEMEFATDSFAPSQDPMAFLAGARDIHLLGPGTAEIPTSEGMIRASYTRYGFTVDGLEFARNMHSQLERQMLRAGDLPPGATLDVTEAYRDLSGQGEIWIDAAGLPLRLMVDLEYPEQYGEQSLSHIKSDFFGFPDQGATVSSVFNQSLNWARRTLNLPGSGEGWADFGLHAVMVIGCLALVLILVGRSRSRAIYLTLAVIIIVSILVSPIWESQKGLAFTEKIQAQRQEAEVQQAAARLKQEQLESRNTTDWDPRQDPLAESTAVQQQVEIPATLAQPLLTTGGEQVASSLGEETPPDPNSDSDGDQLTYQEELRLGTDPLLLNSDLDALGDGLEVKGFLFNGTRYFTDPFSSDTMGDGLVDTLECWTTLPVTLPTNDIGCNQDSDDDGVLDIFEADNDNDGVDDEVDLSPFSKATGFSGDNPFQLVIDNLEQKPVLVDLQIRPTNPEHLAYTLSVLDWPTGDTQGQVQRVLSNTFATAVDMPMTQEEIETDPRAQYGDMRLIPILEIRVPYMAGHTRNLPVKPDFSGTLDRTTPLDEWLDTGKLEMYGMYAHYLDEQGTLGIYVPLNLVEDSLGASDVAFQAHFYYEPQANSNWGNAQQIRVIWWVQVLTDQCVSSVYDENTDGEFEAWCARPENRIETSQVIHTYPEQWSLTGLSIREDYGLEAAVAFEDPDTDTNVNDDDRLWKLANGLDGAFLSARDLEPLDGIRDITVDEIERRFDNRSNAGNGIPDGDARLWNIPKDSLQVWNQDLPHADYMITLVTTTTMQILDQKFLLPAGCQAGCTSRAVAPTLLTATEAHARTANLDFGGTTMYMQGNQLTVDMDPASVSLDTYATVSWVPYRYGADGWEVYPLDQYLDLLDTRLDNYLPRDPLDPESVAQVPGQKVMVFSYYLGLAQGTSTIVQSGPTVTSTEGTDVDIHLTIENGVEAFYRTIEDITTILEVYHGGLLHKLTSKEVEEKNWEDIYENVRRKKGPLDYPESHKIGENKYSKLERTFAGLKIAALAFMALVAITCAALAWIEEVDLSTLTYIQAGLMAFGSTVLLSLSVGQLIRAKLGGTGIWKTISNAFHEFKFKSKGVVLATIAAVVDILAKIGLFIYEWVSGEVELGSVEWWAMFAALMTSIIVTVILFAIYMIPVIGEIVYAVITAINAVLEIVCTALGKEFEESKAGIICSGINGMLSELVYRDISSQESVSDPEYEGGLEQASRERTPQPAQGFQAGISSDLEHEGGLQQSMPELTLDDPNQGFQVGNSLAYSFTVTNTIRAKSEDDLDNWKARQWSHQFNEQNLEKSAYKFLLTRQETDAHDDLYLGIDTDWLSLGTQGGVPYIQIERPLASQQHFPLNTPGINQSVATYYNEGYDVPIQQCWGWHSPPISWCSIKDVADSGHSEIGQYFLYDVFPADLDGFHALQAVSGGYRLAWGGTSMPFPVLKDADGDGMVAGSDPGDASWDFDGDGLSDTFEMQIGTNPRSQDSDNDTVLDRNELLKGSDPTNPDSDHDGLSDQLELAGWDFVYGWVDEHTPKITRVTSDPTIYDSDFDGLSDHKEWLYGWNPQAVSEGEVLTFNSDLTEKDAGGQYSTSDNVVKFGDQLRYEADVKNGLDLRYMRGLLSAEYPAGSLSGSVAPKTFVLGPYEPANISGDLTVSSSSSGPLNLTQIAGAELYQANQSSNYLALLLHLEEPAGATVFLDESGGVKPNNGTCLVGSCPDQRVTGIVGQAVKFTALGQRIDSTTVDISQGSFSAMLWMKTPSSFVTLLNISTGNVLLWITSSGQVEADVNCRNGTAVATSTASVNDDLWHHLAVTFDESTATGTLSIYVDGNLEANKVSGLRTPGLAGLTIGRSYTGDLDEIAVYSRALTAAEIQDAILKSRAGLDAHLDEPANTMTFVDTSGQNRGSCTSGHCPKMEVPGMNRTAAEFDGLDDYIQFPHTPSLDFPDNQDFTVVLWVKPGAPVDTTLIKTGQDSAQIPFQISYSESTHSIRAKRQDNDLHIPAINASVPINDGQFHHVAYVKQGGMLHLYIDGVEQGSTSDTTYGITSDSNPLYIGKGGYLEQYFGGRIDGVRVYRRALSQVEIQELQVSDLVPLDLHFDDPPGTYQFQDANGQPPASCLPSLADCPTSGVPGRWNLAAEFNGSYDSLDAGVAPSVIGTNPLSLAAWVRTTSATYQVIVNQRSRTVYTGEYMFGLRNTGKVYWSTYGNSGAAGFNLISAKAVNDGKWHHVAAVRDVSGSAFIYIDGVLDASQLNNDPTKIAPLVENKVYIGADIRDHTQYFNGAIDELQIWRSALSAAEVGELVGLGPRFQLHLEEANGANSFADDTEQGYNATCSGTSCPKAGVNGQVGLAAEFDGLDDGLKMNFDLINHEGTVMLWVRPNSSTNLPQALIASLGDDIKLYRENGTWKLRMGLGVVLAPADARVRPDEWQHLAIVISPVGAGTTGQLYLDGAPVSDVSLDFNYALRHATIGYDPNLNDQHFDGRMDEVTAYNRALSQGEIKAIFDYQAGWVQQIQRTGLTIDNDPPTVQITLPGNVVTNESMQLRIETADTTTSVKSVLWRVNGGVWNDAPACQGADSAAAWCPTFAPSGPGSYTIEAQATDLAGNSSAIASATLQVDSSAPTATLAQEGALVQLQADPTVPYSWIAALSGTVSDSSPSSGVAAVRVALIDPQGVPMAGDSQSATISGGSWSINYLLTEPLMSGKYTVQLETEDKVGNHRADRLHSIQLDRTVPEVGFDGPPPGGALALWRFEEAAGAVSFADSSGLGNQAVCDLSCPLAGTTGKYGAAIQLSGGQSLKTSRALAVRESGFALSAWFQTNAAAQQTLFAVTDDTGAKVMTVKLDSAGKVLYGFSPPGALETSIQTKKAYNENAWHHLSAAWQPGQVQLFIDGQLLRTIDQLAGSLPPSINVVVGHDGGTEPFTGKVDEVAVHGVHLTPAEVRSLAFTNPTMLQIQVALHGTISELETVPDAMQTLHFEEMVSPFIDSSDYDNDATCADAECPTVDISGPYGVSRRFDGIDDGLTIQSTSLNTLTNSLTVMAWIKPEKISGVQRVLGIAQCSAGGGLGFGLSGSGLIFTTYGVKDYYSSGVGLALNQWQHIAAVMSADNSVTFYVNGTEQQTISGVNPAKICLGDFQIGRSISAYGSPGQWFMGSIDEFQVFSRSLTGNEIQAMARKQLAGIKSLEVAYISDLGGSTRYNSQILPGTQLYLPFDDTEDAQDNLTFLDISGQGFSGSCTQPNCPAVGITGHAGSAAMFDGTDTVTVKPGSGSTNSLTISAWIYPVGSTAYRGTFIVRRNHWSVNCLSDGTIRMWFRDTALGNGYVYPGYKAPLNQWTHLVVVYDGGVFRTYANGKPVGSPITTTGSIYNNDWLYLGGWPGVSEYFGGGLDEVQVITDALTDAEVETLYLGTEPVVHLPLDETWVVTSTVIADKSGWKHNGTLSPGVDDANKKAAEGVVGESAIQLDGMNDYVTLGDVDEVDSWGDLALSQWFNLDTLSASTIGWGAPVGKGAWNGSDGWAVLINNRSGSPTQHKINLYLNGAVIATIPAPSGGWQTGTWYHYAFTRNANTLKGYLNGAEKVSVVSSIVPLANSSPLLLGKHQTEQYFWKGKLDDLQIYRRGLTAEEVQALYGARWQSVALDASGSTVMRTNWNMTLPAGLEGHYQFDLQSKDLHDNHTERSNTWDGVLDTTAPRAIFTYEGGPTTYTFRFSAQDWNLDEGSLQSPCPTSTTLSKTFFNPPWYRALSGVTTVDSSRLYTLEGSCQVTSVDPTLLKMTICDQFGNCTVTNASAANTTAAASAALKPAPASGQVLILEPAPGAIVNNLQPVSISGVASADEYLKRLTISVDGKKVLNQKWEKRTVQAFDWSATWTPTTAGIHLVEASLADWKNADVTHVVTFTLDTASPNLVIVTSVLTTTQVTNSQLPIRGTATDENGIALVEVRVLAQGYTSDWTPAILEGDTWQAVVYPGHGFQPDAEELTVRARATDRSGRTRLISGSLTADLKPPAPSDLEITYDDLGGTYPITRTGTILTGDAPTLHLRWSASSDGARLAGYKAGWIVKDASGVATHLTDFSPTDNLLASYHAGEAQQLFTGAASIDQYGNQQSQGFGPIYVDSPLTPDYIQLDETGEVYHGWMDSGCSLLGQDRRVNDMQPDTATRGVNQALYATWDTQALRLAWTGANWAGDGDLFVYLDTMPDGTLDAMDPYTSTMTSLQLPGVLPVGPRPNAMYADYLVWVQDDQAAWLYRWDGAAWVADSQLGSDQYRFEPGFDNGTTDIYLPFELLGINNPENSLLKLVAFATEEDMLQLWAVLPQSNPVSSPFVTGRPRAEQVFARFALNHPFSWNGLRTGICPNGSQALMPGQRHYTDDHLQLSITTDPVGASYRYLGDHLFGWWLNLWQDKPAEFSSMLARISNELARVEDGEEINYTVHYSNDGAEAAEDVMLQVRSRLALILPDGAPQVAGEHAYFQEIFIGDVAPGQSGTVNVRGKVDLSWAEAAYQDCQARYPNRPLACLFTRRWALLGVQVFDQAHTPSDGPRELMWVDHRVDSEPPLFTGLHSGQYGLSVVKNNLLRGYAFDESGIGTLTLEIQAPDGSTTQQQCNDPTPLDGQWSCGLDLDATAQDGDVYNVRLQVEDGVGLNSVWSSWHTFVVDRAAPEVAVGSAPTSTVYGPPVSLSWLDLQGLIQDNYGVRGVEVCQGGICDTARTQLPAQVWSYADTLAAPLAIGACGGGELVRSFSVPDNQTVGEISLGFQAEISNRDNLVVELTSPAGTSVQVIGDDYDLSTVFENLNVILSDRVGAGLSALRASQVLTAGGFDASVRPLQPLASFKGQLAAGTWQLSICQDSDGGDPALYHGAQLWVEPPNTAPLSGTWQTTHQFDSMDDEEQTLLVYGIDEAGNRSPVPQVLTFRIDNVTPVMTVTQVIPQIVMLPDLSPQTVLAGSVSDGGKVVRMHAYVRDPDGIGSSLRPVVDESLNWQLQLQPMKVGSYQVWIAAEDEAGNLTTVGPFTVEVAEIPASAAALLAPMATATPTATITATLTLTPTMTITPTETITPTMTPMPQPTETPTPAPLPTETPTPALFWIEPPTPTPTTTITATLVLTPTAGILPIIAPASISIVIPTPIPAYPWSWFR